MADLSVTHSVARPVPFGSRPALRPPRLSRQDLWQALWAPWWVWSDMPAPLFPEREPTLTGELGLAGAAVVGGIDAVRRRLWLRHALHPVVRSVWLTLALGCVWMLVDLAGGPAINWPALAVGGGVLLALGIVFAAWRRPSRWETARVLDRSFGLQERMSTAVIDLGRGVPHSGERASVAYLQMADAANAIEAVRRDRVLGPKIPVREIVTVVFLSLVLVALAFLRGVGGGIPPLAKPAVPVFTPAVQRPEPVQPAAAPGPQQLPPTVDEVKQRSDQSNKAQHDLQALANALQNHAVTSSAADDIAQGDYPQAANELRDLAPNANQISPSSRSALANDLDKAAGQMTDANAPLQQAAQNAASGLRQGDQPAQQGVQNLADAVEQTGQQVVSQQELASQMQQAQAAQRAGAAAPGSPGQSGQPQQAQAGQPGANQSGDAAQGSDAQAGDAGQGQTGQGSQQGQGQQGAQSGEGQPGAAGQPGQGEQGAGQAGAQPGPNGQRDGSGGAPQAGDQASQGDGAGSGDANQAAPPDRASGASGGQQQADQNGVPAQQRVTNGDGKGGDPGPAQPVNQTLELPAGPPSNQSVQTSDNGGSSMRGSGAGVTAGSGSAVQGEVGEAGPDSNRVPPDYRSVVERYFTEGNP
ncbi:MAG TPA: hypothetical protein VFI22_16115 [Thermomicrobiales bacterium]|nr:hypothetical protein [Thermomicrobiales bacterium]